jgi:hypothetical protein
MIQKVLAQPHWHGKLTPRDYPALTPLIWEHVNPYGLWVKADSPEALDASLAALARVLDLAEASAKEQNVQTDAASWAG